MKILIKSNDIIFISWVKNQLANHSIKFYVFDEHASSIQGSIGALPTRVLVNDEDFSFAKKILEKNSK